MAERYRLMIKFPVDDLVILMRATHRTKTALREGFALAKKSIKEGKVSEVEAWDDQTNERLGREPKDGTTTT